MPYRLRAFLHQNGNRFVYLLPIVRHAVLLFHYTTLWRQPVPAAYTGSVNRARQLGAPSDRKQQPNSYVRRPGDLMLSHDPCQTARPMDAMATTSSRLQSRNTLSSIGTLITSMVPIWSMSLEMQQASECRRLMMMSFLKYDVRIN